jgi:hypothetical protein
VFVRVTNITLPTRKSHTRVNESNVREHRKCEIENNLLYVRLQVYDLVV